MTASAKPESAPPSAAEVPQLFDKRAVPTLIGIVVVLWVSAAMFDSVWALVGAGVLTLALAGGVFWLWRRARQQQELMSLLQQAQHSPEAREAAMAKLAALDDKNANVLVELTQAQMLAQTDPDAAIARLGAIHLDKAPGEIADQVRTFQAYLLLMKNRVREARDLADRIVVPTSGPRAARAMTAAVVAEAWARSGAAKEGWGLIEAYPPDDPEVAEVRMVILYARVFAAFGAGNKERARKDMERLLRDDFQLLGRFVAPGPGIHIELRKMATDMLNKDPQMRRMGRRSAPPPHQRRR